MVPLQERVVEDEASEREKLLRDTDVYYSYEEKDVDNNVYGDKKRKPSVRFHAPFGTARSHRHNVKR